MDTDDHDEGYDTVSRKRNESSPTGSCWEGMRYSFKSRTCRQYQPWLWDARGTLTPVSSGVGLMEARPVWRRACHFWCLTRSRKAAWGVYQDTTESEERREVYLYIIKKATLKENLEENHPLEGTSWGLLRMKFLFWLLNTEWTPWGLMSEFYLISFPGCQ